jgi:hypothetical protein
VRKTRLLRGEAARSFHNFHSLVDKSLIGGMSKGAGKLRLREVYHHLLLAPSAASEVRTVMRASARAFHWSMFASSPGGDNGGDDVIPLLGEKQEL